jgi:hypothetical protein
MVEMELRKAGITEMEVVAEKYDRIDMNNGKSPRELYDMELVTTLPLYYVMLSAEEERKALFDSVMSCLIEESTPLTNVDIVLKAGKVL